MQRHLQGPWTLLPIVVGHAPARSVAELLEAVWGGPETVVVVSSDLSHYHDYETAAAQDRRTATAIVERTVDGVGAHDACGAFPVRGLLDIANSLSLDVRLLDLRNSGDTAGSRDRVVGYGAFSIT